MELDRKDASKTLEVLGNQSQNHPGHIARETDTHH
jgi:hypothetical protein